MTIRDNLRIWIATNLLLWLGLLSAPVLLADDAWHDLPHPEIDHLYINAGVDRAVHRFVHVEPVSVWYPNGAADADAQADALRTAAAAQFSAALDDRGLTEVAEAVDASVVVRVQMIDLRATPVSPEILDWARQFRFRVAPGRITLVAEMRDARTGRVLVRMADLDDAATNAANASADYALAQWGDAVAAAIAPYPTDLRAAIAD